MTESPRLSAAPPRRPSLPARWPTRALARYALSATLVGLVAAGCGKKGPPLAPFSRTPAAVGAVTPQRIGDDVYVSFAVPTTNADGQKPVEIGSLEVYAVTSELVPQTEEQKELAALIATVPVRPILPALPPPAGNESAPPPLPLPPGIDRESTAVIREPLTPETQVPVELPVEEKPSVEEIEPEEQEPFGPLVAPPITRLPRRHYFVVAVSPRGRESAPSGVASIPLEPGSSAPGAPQATNDAKTLTLTWPPSPDARSGPFLLPPTPKPVAANVTPANVTAPKLPAPLPPLNAKTLGFASEATRYHLYDVTPPPTNVTPSATNATPPVTPAPPPPEPDPYAIKVPTPITPAPLLDTEFVISGVAFGVERCFEVRPVDTIHGATVIGPASPRTCVTPQDTFPPLAPRSLAAITAPGVINLIWDANTEPDLAGYLVLRGEAPGATLQALTTEPITTNTFRDTTVTPGTRYVYAVVAVDRAVPQNVSAQSNRVEETAR
ncbi:MAG TPA: hypothetical protein VEC39_13395 [Vicinamibacterales bacterium]|nr:hypothetical protein [Vicinamibacterales bacterium]